MARLRASWRTSLPVVQQPRNPQSESIARPPYQGLGGAAADVFMRLGGRVLARLPGYAGMRHGLKRPRLVLAPDRQPQLGAEHVGSLDQPLFTAASGSLTRTTPCLRWRITTPVSHQVRLFCQLRPASCRVRQIVNVLTFG